MCSSMTLNVWFITSLSLLEGLEPVVGEADITGSVGLKLNVFTKGDDGCERVLARDLLISRPVISGGGPAMIGLMDDAKGG